jgi:NTE family protein
MSNNNANDFPKETVLLLVAGGSLGAYECGVFKCLAKHNIWFDIVAGTSIGAVNATIIVDSIRKNLQNKNKDRHKMLMEAAERLELFWLESADNITPKFLPFKIRSYLSASNTFTFGHPNALIPIWFYPGGPLLNNGFTLPYLYDTSIFKQVLHRTVDFGNLTSNKDDDNNRYIANDSPPRLILTCTDIKEAEPSNFDTNTMDITAEHLSACIAYPFYGLKWAEVDGKYLWDGSLLSSSPLRAVMGLSPFKEKMVISIDTFPRHQEKFPNNFAETWHRARDITFLDKSRGETEVSGDLKTALHLLKEMHDIVMDTTGVLQDKKLKDRFEQLEKKYNHTINRRGRIINELIQIRRNEDEKSHHSIFEDWDFSIETIRELIKQGEEDAEFTLEKKTSQLDELIVKQQG